MARVANEVAMASSRRVSLSLGSSIVLIMCLVKLLSPHFEDPDFYWHIRAGEILLSTWPPGKVDVFSYPNSGHPWVLAEWGGQVLIYLVFHNFGYIGIAWFVAVICALILGIVYRCCLVLGCKEGRAAAMTVLCGFVLLEDPPRPHLFTLLLLALLLYLLLEFKYDNNREGRLRWLPVIMVLWANLHGGYFIGVVLMALFAMCEWLMYGLGTPSKEKRQKLVRLSLWMLGGTFATLLSPETILYWWYPIKAIFLLGDLSGDAQQINEWQSPSFHILVNQFFLLLVGALGFSLIFSRKRPDLTEAAIPAMFITAMFIAVRNLPLAVIATVPFLGKFSSDLTWPVEGTSKHPFIQRWQRLYQKLSKEPVGEDGQAQWIHLLLVAVVGLTILLIYPRQQQKIMATVEMYMPVKATDFLVREYISGNMYNAYQYGGYLIYRLYPAQKVFIYGRTDIFRPGFLREHNAIYQGRADWKQYFDHYHIDYVLCDTDAAIRQILLASGAFTRVYEDRFHSLLVRNEPRFSSLIARFGR